MLYVLDERWRLLINDILFVFVSLGYVDAISGLLQQLLKWHCSRSLLLRGTSVSLMTDLLRLGSCCGRDESILDVAVLFVKGLDILLTLLPDLIQFLYARYQFLLAEVCGAGGSWLAHYVGFAGVWCLDIAGVGVLFEGDLLSRRWIKLVQIHHLVVSEVDPSWHNCIHLLKSEGLSIQWVHCNMHSDFQNINSNELL